MRGLPVSRVDAQEGPQHIESVNHHGPRVSPELTEARCRALERCRSRDPGRGHWVRWFRDLEHSGTITQVAMSDGCGLEHGGDLGADQLVPAHQRIPQGRDQVPVLSQ